MPTIYTPDNRVIDIMPSTEGVLGRRVMAYVIDLVFIALFSGIFMAVAGLLTVLSFGLLHPLFVLLPLIGISYTTLTIGSGYGATWGMRLMSLAYRRDSDGRAPDLVQAFVVTVLFYLSIGFTVWLVLLVPLFTNRHRTLHDILAGLVMVRMDALVRR